MASSFNITLITEKYKCQKDIWPKTGRHILAQFDDQNIVVYQAFCNEIADYVVMNGHFGGPFYNCSRMTWIKTSFLWMMYRAGWATKPKQERILAIFLSKEGFDQILSCAKGGGGVTDNGKSDDVRLQWDPDHSPFGTNMERRAIQLGLRGEILKKFHERWIQKIEDVTDFVAAQRAFIDNGNLEELSTPRERIYIPHTADICRNIRLDNLGESVTSPSNISNTQSGLGQVCTLTGEVCRSKNVGEPIKEKKTESNERHEREEIILCLGGAFNPVHTKHIQLMIEVKKWLEEHANFNVISGWLAVATDGYVKGKCRKSHQHPISGNHRISMCKIACGELDWLKPFPVTIGSANDCGRQVKQELMRPNIKVAVVVGADRAYSLSGRHKWLKRSENITVCVGRKGETEKVEAEYYNDLDMSRVSNWNFFIIPLEMDNVSSSDVREHLAELNANDESDTKNQTIIQELCDLGWIDNAVGQYILDNLSDIYMRSMSN